MGDRPQIVCLCGSTRFYEAFQHMQYVITMVGGIFLSPGVFAHAADRAHGGDVGLTPEEKAMLDELHRAKIRLADRVLIVSDHTGYYGASTSAEIAYARELGKPVKFATVYAHPITGRMRHSYREDGPLLG